MRTLLIFAVTALSVLTTGCFDSRRTTNMRDGGRPPTGDAGGCGALVECLGLCVDVTSDATNCGECGLTCAPGEACVGGACAACTPRCEEVECGDDGCGGSCGACPFGESCSGGICEGGCTPDCADAECGSDGCGGSCGTCPFGTVCSGSFCEDTCTPECDGRECGTDGCGGSCGTCPTGTVCTGVLCEETCTPDCFGLMCGDDGCGGSCGTCPAGSSCSASGTCTSSTGGGESCSSPTAIASTGGSYTFTLTGRSAHHTPLSCGSTSGMPDVAFRVTPTRSGTATFVTSGSNDTVMAVFSSSTCTTSLFCDDDGAGVGTNSRISMSVTSGTTYYVVIAQYSGTTWTGSSTLTVTMP